MFPFFSFFFLSNKAQRQTSPHREQSLTKIQSNRASRRNNQKNRASRMGTVLFTVSDFQLFPWPGSKWCFKRRPVLARAISKVWATAWIPQEAFPSYHPSFQACGSPTRSPVEPGDKLSIPFYTTKLPSSLYTIRSKHKLNRIGISCSFSPTPGDFILFFRDGEKQKVQLQNLGMPKREFVLR